MTPEIQKVSYVNGNISAGLVQLALPNENGKLDIIQ